MKESQLRDERIEKHRKLNSFVVQYLISKVTVTCNTIPHKTIVQTVRRNNISYCCNFLRNKKDAKRKKKKQKIQRFQWKINIINEISREPVLQHEARTRSHQSSKLQYNYEYTRSKQRMYTCPIADAIAFLYKMGEKERKSERRFLKSMHGLRSRIDVKIIKRDFPGQFLRAVNDPRVIARD